MARTTSPRRRVSDDLMSTMFNMDDFHRTPKSMMRLLNLFLSEAFGTGILLFLLCAVVNTLTWKPDEKENIIAIGLTGGFAVGTAVFCFGHISGPHINPAISMAAVFLGKISLPVALVYIIAQCSGSFCAYALTVAIIPSDVRFENTNDHAYAIRCCSVPDGKLGAWQVLLTEFIGTSILTFAFCSAVDKRNHDKEDSLPLKFGMVIIALIVPIASYSSCSLNPARSFGPAAFNMFWKYQWYYWLGPMMGSIFTAILYRYVFDPSYMENATSMSPPLSGPSELTNMLGQKTYTFTNDDA